MVVYKVDFFVITYIKKNFHTNFMRFLRIYFFVQQTLMTFVKLPKSLSVILAQPHKLESLPYISAAGSMGLSSFKF